MDIENPEAKRYLEELSIRTQGDTTQQVSMFDVGEAVGLEKAEAGALAEDLIVQGWVELKTLSGGIGITSEGLELIRGPGAGKDTASAGLQLGDGPILAFAGRQAVEKVLADIRAGVQCQTTSFERIEEMVIDVKTIEVQMLSARPKIGIIREVLRSLQAGLEGVGMTDLAATVDALIAL